MPNALNLTELAELVKGTIVKPAEVLIRGIDEPETGSREDCAFLLTPRPLAELEVGVLITGPKVTLDFPQTAHITVANPRLAFAQALGYFHPQPVLPPASGVHPQAFVDPTATVHPTARIGWGTYVGPRVVVGAGTILFPGVYIGAEVTLGAGCMVYPNAVILDRSVLGDRVMVFAGVVIGSDGFGYVSTAAGHFKVPQTGRVVLEDDVEVGANSTIDRATLKETRIGRGSKIDNLVMVAHNCQIGEHCMIISQVGIAGSVKIGDRTIIAAQAGLAGRHSHLEVGSDSVIFARSGVTRSLPKGAQVSGFPAQDHRTELKEKAALTRLPALLQQVRKLQQRVQDLERDRDQPQTGS
ncbi:UDP-3-O-(3-hydroxymyristoyl)glucosamine N-acyltransferase [Anthocerotibacter panamensis]|uniref:UDP-3-O-(3-hydroxymyristoyl)glucosamine N-acyltransferase n=1 Tax=Anthocerotibacter panamensis TaxID=2857077 RepID=UPI001C402EB4|nr:UDP-3-O-(3-hydroxymyristoyl)glucosamine N-acyltransferase [Anthocerotibacter panamensis]